jgi:putative CocE/NonD family hydrolase
LERVVRIEWLIFLLLAAHAGVLRGNGLIKIMHVRIPMRDGVQLAANLFRPTEPARVPAILVRTPYGKGEDITPHYQAFVNHGYAIVVEDVRGRYESDGVFKPLEQEGKDGSDTIDWIARQAWSDGKVGMMGGSYLGIVQWKAALQNNPHLKAIFPVVSGDDDYRDRFYSRGGAMKIGNRLNWMSDNLRTPMFKPDFNLFIWHLPLRTADVAATGQTSDMYQDAINHPAFDTFWKSISTRERLGKIKVPVFAAGGWYDNFVDSDLEAYMTLRKNSNVNRILIGPWPHNMSYKFQTVDYGKDSAIPLRTLQMEWFDQWLKAKDTPLLSKPPVRVFLMGANRWIEEREWPVARARLTPFFLASRKSSNTLDGTGTLGPRPARAEAPDTYVYDPRNPVPTRGGAVCCNPKVFPWGPMDQRPVERRRDVLVYSTAPLKRDLEVVGQIRVVLYASTSARDTDFTAKLVDVLPDGEARNLTDGILRLRYRDSIETPQLAQPGHVYKLTIEAGATANLFQKGHRIRLEISSSNFPRFDRNPNTGGPLAEETRLLKASQTIYHDRLRPSCVLLPVVP